MPINLLSRSRLFMPYLVFKNWTFHARLTVKVDLSCATYCQEVNVSHTKFHIDTDISHDTHTHVSGSRHFMSTSRVFMLGLPSRSRLRRRWFHGQEYWSVPPEIRHNFDHGLFSAQRTGRRCCRD